MNISRDPPHVLVAEDDALVGEMIQGMLEELSYHVVGIATDGEQAVRMTESLQPDIILMDIEMPVLDGITAARRIYELCPTPVIMLTAYETPEMLEQANAAGIAAYLVKPSDIREMERAISVALARFEDLVKLRHLNHKLQTEIARRKRVEKTLRLQNQHMAYLNDELEDIVAQRTTELQKALERAQVADQAKSQFITNISHELRTPITTLTLYLDLLNRGKDKKQMEYLAVLKRETKRLYAIIENLLHISRLDLNRLQISPQPTDLNALTHTLIDDREMLATKKGLQLIFRPDDTLPPVYADSKLIEQALTNLLTNAINYTPTGGEITIHTALSEFNSERFATISIIDNGKGIHQEELPYIFERFFRGKAAQESNIAGTGLGLAISKEIVEHHKGRITVESQAGEGSQFTIWLPLEPSD